MSDEQRQRRLEWRARREARRENQREQNVVRAAIMHELRCASEQAHDPVDAWAQSLPPVLVGCSGWYYWHWRDCFYPAELPGSRWFDFYASHFRTVELNAPFYSWPTETNVRTWLRQAGRRRLIYTVKVSELITHQKRFVRTRSLVRDFNYIADLLGPRMGCFLYQFPASFRYSPAALKRIVTQLDARRRNVVEFRHRGWWNERVFAAFRDHKIIFCSCSGPRLPDDLVKTTDEVYIRFHGTKRWYRHDYTRQELAHWTRQIDENRPTRVWAYFNNDREGFAIKNARAFIRQLKQVI